VKSVRIAWQLLWANRWLWLLLVLWPWAMAMFLLVGGDAPPAADDVEAVLQQEGVYGLALVAFAGGALLGAEQRSRRIVMVLARAVSRRQYLAALWMAAYLPLVAYALDLLLTGLLLRAPHMLLEQTGAALLMLGAITASLAVLVSLVVPGVIAGGLSLGIVSLLLALSPGWQIALTRLLQVLLSGPVTEWRALIFSAGLAESAALTAVLFELAVRIFEQRDLRLKVE
jgi:hypothetical protein